VQVLNYVRVSVQTRKVNIEAVDRMTAGTTITRVPVDSYLQELHVSVSGGNQRVELKDPNGRVMNPVRRRLGNATTFRAFECCRV